MSSNVLVIGNGFDLSLGLETSYFHFIDNYYLKEKKYSLNMVQKIFPFLKNKSPYPDMIWADIEEEYKELLHLYSNQKNSEAIDRLNSSMNLFEDDLCKYLKKVDREFQKNIGTYIVEENFIEVINKVDKILYFNYTTSLETIILHMNKGKDTEREMINKIKYVHGSVKEENIIMGYYYDQESESFEFDSCYKNDKVVRKINGFIDDSVSKEKIESLYILGHSLVGSDLFYLISYIGIAEYILLFSYNRDHVSKIMSIKQYFHQTNREFNNLDMKITPLPSFVYQKSIHNELFNMQSLKRDITLQRELMNSSNILGKEVDNYLYSPLALSLEILSVTSATIDDIFLKLSSSGLYKIKVLRLSGLDKLQARSVFSKLATSNCSFNEIFIENSTVPLEDYRVLSKTNEIIFIDSTLLIGEEGTTLVCKKISLLDCILKSDTEKKKLSIAGVSSLDIINCDISNLVIDILYASKLGISNIQVTNAELYTSTLITQIDALSDSIIHENDNPLINIICNSLTGQIKVNGVLDFGTFNENKFIATNLSIIADGFMGHDFLMKNQFVNLEYTINKENVLYTPNVEEKNERKESIDVLLFTNRNYAKINEVLVANNCEEMSPENMEKFMERYITLGAKKAFTNIKTNTSILERKKWREELIEAFNLLLEKGDKSE